MNRQEFRVSYPEEKAEITNEQIRTFLLTLLSFHQEKKVTIGSVLQIGIHKGTTSVFLDHEPISIRKCLIGIQMEFTITTQNYVKAFCE